MPFPKLQPMPLPACSGPQKLVYHEFGDDGLGSVIAKDLHEKLPPAENFDLAALIKNKIPLQEVSSKILGGNTLTIHVTESKKDDKQTNTNPDEGE